ncbi:MAG: TRAP transporter substrate-binding protein [Bacteroidales bacterium]
MIRTAINSVILILIVCLSLVSCRDAEHVTVLKLAHGLAPSHSVHQGMVYMADLVEEKSDGHMRIDIYASSQLGSERENVEMLQIGSLAITKVSAAIMESFAPNYRVLNLPYIFKNKEHTYRVLDSEIGREILLDGQDFWLRGLAFYDSGSRSFYTKDRPIMHPDDLRGLKIRVMPSPSAVNMIRAMGGSPTPISWGELYTALQGGVVDGAENNPPSFYLSHHFEVCRYYTINEHSTIPDVLLISTKIWNTLTEQEQIWLQEAADESAIHQRILWAESEEYSLKQAEAAGVEILYPDKEPFIEKVQGLYEEFKKDEQLQSFIERIQEKETPVSLNQD